MSGITIEMRCLVLASFQFVQHVLTNVDEAVHTFFGISFLLVSRFELSVAKFGEFGELPFWKIVLANVDEAMHTFFGIASLLVSRFALSVAKFGEELSCSSAYACSHLTKIVAFFFVQLRSAPLHDNILRGSVS